MYDGQSRAIGPNLTIAARDGIGFYDRPALENRKREADV